MKLQWLALLSVMVISLAGSISAQQAPEKYALVELTIDRAKIGELQELGLPLDCSFCIPDKSGEAVFICLPLTAHDMQSLDGKSISYRVVHEDVAGFYEQRILGESDVEAEAARTATGTSMDYGTLGGYYTYQEIGQTLDKLTAQYGSKGLITAKFVIGKSYEGREIHAIKISDNAGSDESGQESQVLYTALTHAREPGGMMTLFYYMYYLLENYPTDQRVKNIVENCELFFVPCVNPDGYSYNQKGYPNGGGMWRKNRDGSGIDLNRNFGPYELWNYSNSGSSTSPSSDTYRGTAPFSEPETKALSDFVLGKKFRTALNYHTYSNLLIYPWGYVNQVADPKFPTMAKEMTRVNGYRHGTAQSLLYAVRGDSDSWFFKVAKVYSMTPEVGGYSDGFWPQKTRIFPLAQENLQANLLLAEYALQLPQDRD